MSSHFSTDNQTALDEAKNQLSSAVSKVANVSADQVKQLIPEQVDLKSLQHLEGVVNQASQDNEATASKLHALATVANSVAGLLKK